MTMTRYARSKFHENEGFKITSLFFKHPQKRANSVTAIYSWNGANKPELIHFYPTMESRKGKKVCSEKPTAKRTRLPAVIAATSIPSMCLNYLRNRL